MKKVLAAITSLVMFGSMTACGTKSEEGSGGKARRRKIILAFYEITAIICYVTSVFMKEFRSSELLSICNEFI